MRRFDSYWDANGKWLGLAVGTGIVLLVGAIITHEGCRWWIAYPGLTAMVTYGWFTNPAMRRS